MTEAAALASARSANLPPLPDRDSCECAGCYERRRADAERRTWRELDDARRSTVRLLPGSEDRCEHCGRVLDCCGNCNHCDTDQPRRAE